MDLMATRWSEKDRYGNIIYLTQERWSHIVDPINHPEMKNYEQHLKETIKMGKRTQNPLNPLKYRYSFQFGDLIEYNTHIIAIVLFKYEENREWKPVTNNYIGTAYQKEMG